MKEFAGTPGTVTSLVMRVLQIVFAIATVTLISFIDLKISSNLIYVLPPHMCQILWCFICGTLDAYALWNRRKVHNRMTVTIYLIVDWMFAFASLGAGAIYACILDLFLFDTPLKEVRKIRIFLLLVFLGWIPTVILSLILLWILPVAATTISRPDVHPLPPPVDVDADNNLPRMTDIQGMSGTVGGLLLRLIQCILALVSFCIMVTNKYFPTTTGFRYLLIAVGIEFVWSLCIAIADIYAMSIQRRLLNLGFVRFLAIGDGIRLTMVYAAICGCSGVLLVVGADLHQCSTSHCAPLVYAIVFGLAGWFVGLISFFLNYWWLASR